MRSERAFVRPRPRTFGAEIDDEDENEDEDDKKTPFRFPDLCYCPFSRKNIAGALEAMTTTLRGTLVPEVNGA